MKFRYKVFFLCLFVYVVSLSIIGIIVVKDTYYSLINKEIERSLQQEENIYDSARMYLYINDKQSEEKITVEDYSQKIVDMLSGGYDILMIFNKEREMLATSSMKKPVFDEKALMEAFDNQRNYIMKREYNKHYLIINHPFEFNDLDYALSYVKDITHLDNQKNELILLFLKVGIIGLIFISMVTAVISKLLMKPVDKLSLSAKGIASGDYGNRVLVESNDEIGTLALQFNKMAEEIENKIFELKNESEKKQRFIDNLTHELRTPLTSIIGYAELLMNIKYDEQKFYKGLNYIHSEGKRMLKLSRTLMSLILMREDPLKLEEYNVKKLLLETAGIMRVKANEKNIKILVEGQAVKIPIDLDMMKGVFFNLIDNAIKACNGGECITLGVQQSEGKTVIYVKDEGKGMSEDDVNKVLEPFYRVDKSRSRKEGGVGLGLSLCCEIIKRHGAELKIVSKLGEGTVVQIVNEGGEVNE